MSEIFASDCKNCAYGAHMNAGRLPGKDAWRVVFPIFCDQCQDITSTDYSAEPIQCARCQSEELRHIDDPSVYLGDGEHTLYTWFGEKRPGMRTVRVGMALSNSEKLTFRQKLSRRFRGYHMAEEPARVTHTITDGHYLCPRCLTYNLKLVFAT